MIKKINLILKKTIVLFVLISMVYSQAVFAAQQVRQSASKTTKSVPASHNIKGATKTQNSDTTGKISNADSIPYPDAYNSNAGNAGNMNSSISYYLSGLVSKDLSSQYAVPLTTGYFNSDKLAMSTQFSLIARYSSNNNSNLWGIGNGWNLNIPFLTVKMPNNAPNNASPDKIYLNAGGMSSVFNKTTINQGNNVIATYLPIIRQNNNAFLNIILVKNSDGNYNFILNNLNNPNQKLIFIANSQSINNTSFIVTSDIYNNSPEPIHIRYLDSSGNASTNNTNNGLIIYGKSIKESNIQLKNIYPGYQADVANLSYTKPSGLNSNNSYCQTGPGILENSQYVNFPFVQSQKIVSYDDGSHWDTDGDARLLTPQQAYSWAYQNDAKLNEKRGGKLNFIFNINQKVGTDDNPNFINCPNKSTSVQNIINKSANSEQAIETSNKYSKTITTTLPNKPLVTITLNGTYFDTQFNNILDSIEGGNVVYGNKVNDSSHAATQNGNTVHDTTYTAMAGNLYSGAILENVLFKNSLMTLDSISWSIKDYSKFKKSTSFNYNLLVGDVPFENAPDKMSPKLSTIYGLSGLHTMVPLLSYVKESSSLSADKFIVFNYGNTTAQTFYTAKAALDNAWETPLTDIMNNNSDIGNLQVIDDNQKQVFYYTLSVSIQDAINLPKHKQSMSFSWGEDGHNAYDMIGSLIKIQSESDADRDIRSQSSFLSSVDGLVNSSGKKLSDSDLSNAGYTIVKTIGNSKTMTHYNRYGLVDATTVCDVSNKKERDCNHFNKKSINYSGAINNNQSLIINNYSTINSFLSSPIIDMGNKEINYYDGIIINSSDLNYNYNNNIFTAHYYLGNYSLYKTIKTEFQPAVFTDQYNNSYFSIKSTTVYNRPFTPSNFSTINYNYSTKQYNGNSYLVLLSTDSNRSNLRKLKTVYKYDDYLRRIQTRSCVINTINTTCNIYDPDTRYAKSFYTSYNDSAKTIESYGNLPGTYSKVTLNADGQPNSIMDSNGATTTYSYDTYDRPTEVKQANIEGNILSDNKFSYTSDNNTTTQTVTDMYGNMSEQISNKLGQIISSTGPELRNVKSAGLGKNTVAYSYDNAGHVVEVNNILNGTTVSKVNSTYDYLNRPLSITTTYPQIFVDASASLKQNKLIKQKKKSHKASNLATTDSTLPLRTVREEYSYNYINNGTTTETKSAIGSVMGIQSLPNTLIGNNNFKQYRYTNDFINNESTNYYTPPKGSEIQVGQQVINYTNSGATVKSTSFGAPDVTVNYDTIGRLLNKGVQGGTTINYNYDDLDRAVGAYYIPFFLHYDDNGMIDARVYSNAGAVGDTSNLNNIVKYNYTTVCLMSSGCDHEYKKAYVLKDVSVYSSGTINLMASNGSLIINPTSAVTVTGSPIHTSSNEYDTTGLISKHTEAEGSKSINTSYMYDYTNNMFKGISSINYTNSSNITSQVKKTSTDAQGRVTGLTYNSNISDPSKIITKTSTFDDYGFGTVKQTTTICKTVGCANNIVTDTTIDPRTGMLLNASKILANNTGYLKTFIYDDQGRVTNVLTNDLPGYTSHGNYYNNVAYNYYDNKTNINYGALSSTVTNYSSKDNNITSNYDYNDKGLLSSRSYTINEKDPDDGSSSNSTLVTEGYIYDSLNRLKHFSCSGSMCPSDKNSNNEAISSRDYDFINSSNKEYRISSISTTTASNNTYKVSYNYLNSSNTGSVADALYSVISDSNKLSPIYITNDVHYQRMSKICTITENNGCYSLQYDADGLVNNISTTSNSYLNINRSLLGITNIGNNTNNIDYYDNNLYKQQSDSNLMYNSGGNTSPDMQINLNNGNIKHNIKDINGRVVLQQMNNNGGADKSINSYTPYGTANTHQFYYTNDEGMNPQDQSIFYGENGALTAQFNSNVNGVSNTQQFQVLGDRVYMPGLGSFTQYDSMSPFGMGGVNGWSYSSGNPIGYSDPSGHFGDVFSNGTDTNLGFSVDSFSIANPNSGSVIMAQSFLLVFSVFDVATFGFDIALDGVSFMGTIGLVGTGANVISLSSGIDYEMTGNPTAGKVAKYSGYTAMGASAISFAYVGFNVGRGIYNAVSSNIDEISSPPPGCFTGDTRVLVIINNLKKASTKEKQHAAIDKKTGHKALLKIKDVKVGMVVATGVTAAVEQK